MSGISLIEIIIYIALLGGISVFIANSLISISNLYHRARAEREVLSNARLVLETISRSVAQAEDVYTPTGRFNSDSGQLSLITPVSAQTGHTTAYADYWLDNGRVWAREEGGTAIPLTSASVRASRLRFEHLLAGYNREAVKITLQIDYALPKFSSSITLNSTAVLRGSY